MKKPVLYVVGIAFISVFGGMIGKTLLTDQFDQRLAEKDAQQKVLGQQILATQDSLTRAEGQNKSLDRRVSELAETVNFLKAKNILLAQQLEDALPPKIVPNQIYIIGKSWHEGKNRYAFIIKVKNFHVEQKGPLEVQGSHSSMDTDGKWQRVKIDDSIRAGDDEPTTGLVYSVNESTVRQYNVNEYLKQNNTATP